MNSIITIVKKEFKDIIRDRKTLVMTFFIPIILMPLLFSFIFSSVGDMSAPSEDNKYKIILETDSTALKQMFKDTTTIELVKASGQDAIDQAYDGEALVYVKVDEHFEQALQNNTTPSIALYYDTTSQKAQTAVQMIQGMFTSYQTSYVSQIMAANGLPEQALQPFDFVTHAKDESVDSMSAMILGMLIPMMIIGYSATGIVPIATDLGAGEKERGTLEPLLSTSVSRSSILIAKLIVTATFGVITSVLSGVGVILALQYGLSDMAFSVNIPTSGLAIILGLAVLFSLFMSAVLLMVSTYARSLKEANTYLTPCTLIPMLFSIVTMYMDPNTISIAMMNIPIFNVVMVIKEIVINQLNYTHLYLTIGWSLVYIVLAMFIAKKMYEKEEIVFRT